MLLRCSCPTRNTSTCKRVVKAFMLALLALVATVTSGFQHRSPCRIPRRTVLFSNADFSSGEIKEMEDLILSISKEPTDETRRTRLGQVFAEALARPNGAPKRFSDLFDQTLISVGDEVRGKAIAKALQLQESAEPADDTTTNTTPAEKSVEELQVWALVDMMVQSKTIVKKSSGDLGNKGTFA